MQPLVRLVFGEFDLDEARFELRHRGRVVVMQPKALELILYLARHRERVVTKEELFREVWKGAMVTEASLSQALSLARRALDDSAEHQHAIRTVRGRGLQFVAIERVGSVEGDGRRFTPPASKRVEPRELVATGIETAQEVRSQPLPGGLVPQLTAVLHCDEPTQVGAGWSLAAVDEVEIGRGTTRRAEYRGELTRLLRVAIPGRLMSRTHARLVRTPDGWLLVDASSRNGTYVGGRKATKHVLVLGDLFECGHTVFRFGVAQTTEDGAAQDAPEAPLFLTLSPNLQRLANDLTRIAASELPVMLVGEGGVGKTGVACALHARSGRSGALVQLDARALPPEGLRGAAESGVLARARGGTLLIKHLEALSDADAALLSSGLDAKEDVRLVSTSLRTSAAGASGAVAELWQRLSGYVGVLPPLRERIEDIGAAVATELVLQESRVTLDVPASLALLDYAWPGNLRELSLKLRAAVMLADDGLVRIEHLPSEIRGASAQHSSASVQADPPGGG